MLIYINRFSSWLGTNNCFFHIRSTFVWFLSAFCDFHKCKTSYIYCNRHNVTDHYKGRTELYLSYKNNFCVLFSAFCDFHKFKIYIVYTLLQWTQCHRSSYSVVYCIIQSTPDKSKCQGTTKTLALILHCFYTARRLRAI